MNAYVLARMAYVRAARAVLEARPGTPEHARRSTRKGAATRAMRAARAALV